MKIFYVTIFLLHAGQVLTLKCPPGCKCEDFNRNVKCHVPAARSITQAIIPRNITKLDLSGNNILNVPSGSLKSTSNLEEINFDKNKVYFLENGAFKGLGALRKISLEDNNLHYIEAEVFSPLENLQELNLNENHISQFPKLQNNKHLSTLSLSENDLRSIPDEALSKNTMLKEVYLNSNQFKDISNSVFPKDVSNITVLNLAGNMFRNTPEIVKQMTNLETLKLCYNPIKVFGYDDLRNLVKLKKLTLSEVGLDKFPENIPISLNYLDVSNNQINGNSLANIGYLPNLATLKVKNNPIGVIGSSTFGALAKLETLVASSCDISVIHDNAFVPLQQLKKLDLRDNSLSSFPVLQANSKLEEIYLDNNRIRVLNLGVFSSMDNLKTLSLANNSLLQLMAPVGSSPALHLPILSLNLAGNKFAEFPVQRILMRMPNLTSLDMSRNLLSGNFSTTALTALPNLDTLNVKKNNISGISSDSENQITSLKKLYMCGNDLTMLGASSLSSFSNLEEFTADGNHISYITKESFVNNALLKKISLVSNNLDSIDGNTFTQLSELAELKLIYNNLTTPPNIAQNHKLTVLGLCNNRIGNLPPGYLSKANAIEVLLFRSMGLTSLDANVFGNTRAIRYINLALDNELTKVPPVIRNMTSLRLLKLTGNPIEKISEDCFEGLNNLREIWLDKMRLTSMDVTGLFPALPALRSLRLSGNPWECDCEMQWYVLGIDGARARVTTEDRSELTCTAPRRLRGKSFDYLRLRDFRHCKETSVAAIQETSVSVRLPSITALSPRNDVFNRVSYVSLPGREESVLIAEKNKKFVHLTGLIPDTTYLLCVSTLYTSHGSMKVPNSLSENSAEVTIIQNEKKTEEKESCLKFKTKTPSVQTPWAIGGIGGSKERSEILNIIYAALGGALGVAFIVMVIALVCWGRRTRKKRGRALQSFSQPHGTNGVSGNVDHTTHVEETPSGGGKKKKRKSNKMEEENGEVVEMARESSVVGQDNLACNVTGAGQRTKL